MPDGPRFPRLVGEPEQMDRANKLVNPPPPIALPPPHLETGTTSRIDERCRMHRRTAGILNRASLIAAASVNSLQILIEKPCVLDSVSRSSLICGTNESWVSKSTPRLQKVSTLDKNGSRIRVIMELYVGMLLATLSGVLHAELRLEWME
ncbi:hypothetical protein Trydic_g21228 [Trypoxylus dichotomus]